MTDEGRWLEGQDERTERDRMEEALSPVTDTPLDLDAIEARAVAVAHHRTGPGRCACGYDAYKVGGFFPDYHALLMNHLARAPRAVTPANTDDVLALVAALRDAQAEAADLFGGATAAHRDFLAAHARAEKAEAQVAAVLALADGWTLPERQPFEPLPSERAAGLNAAARAIRAALGGAS